MTSNVSIRGGARLKTEAIAAAEFGMASIALSDDHEAVRKETLLFVALGLLGASVPLALLALVTAIGQPPTWNDFHAYWLAARLLMAGQSPYDLDAMRSLGQAEGLRFVLGTGYSYPLPFAFLMIPLALLPFDSSILIFSAVSLIGFGLLVAWWLTTFHPSASAGRLLAAAVAAGLFPPIFGSVDNGQANLVVLVPFAIGIALTATPGRRDGLGGGLLGLAVVVKLVPGAVVAMLLGARRWIAAGAAVATILGTLVVAEVLAPPAALGVSWLSRLFEPDPYFTNQSINGFVSRLVLPSGRSVPLAPQAFDPFLFTLLITVSFGLATVAVLAWTARASMSERALVLGIALALVAATIAAPKNSFWNQALALPAVGLLVAAEAADLEIWRFGRIDAALFASFWIGSFIQFALWVAPLPSHGTFSGFVTLAGSAALYGMIALWVLLVRRLIHASGGSRATRFAVG